MAVCCSLPAGPSSVKNALHSHISQPVWMNWSSVLHGNQVWLSCKWGKPRWRWMLCKKTAAIHGRRGKLWSCQLHGSFCYWVLFGPCIINWITRRKSSDWLKLVPALAEALGSLQHSHIYQFYLHILWEASLGAHTFFCLNLCKLRLNEKTNLCNKYPSGSPSWSWVVLQGVKQVCQWGSYILVPCTYWDYCVRKKHSAQRDPILCWDLREIWMRSSLLINVSSFIITSVFGKWEIVFPSDPAALGRLLQFWLTVIIPKCCHRFFLYLCEIVLSLCLAPEADRIQRFFE